MKTEGTYFQNDPQQPVRFGEITLASPARVERRGLPSREALDCQTVLTGFCGTDWELMQMGRQGLLAPKFPAGTQRLVNGHEGVVWVPSEKRYAVVLIRGGEAYDPSRFESSEDYFEYGCDRADGLMCRQPRFHPDMLLKIPEAYLRPGQKLSATLGQRLVFADGLACLLFQRERLEDLLMGHNWRLFAAQGLKREAAMDAAVRDGFQRIVIYGLGATGSLAVIAIKAKYPDAKIVCVGLPAPGGQAQAFLQRHWKGVEYFQAGEDLAANARALEAMLGGKPRIVIGSAGSAAESEVAFKHGLLDNNGIYVSFSLGPELKVNTMPFGFKNQLIYGAINFRRDHMEEAIEILGRTPMEETVRAFPLEPLARDPLAFYQDIFKGSDRAAKSVCVWAPELMG